jgi:hypothetical protein
MVNAAVSRFRSREWREVGAGNGFDQLLFSAGSVFWGNAPCARSECGARKAWIFCRLQQLEWLWRGLQTAGFRGRGCSNGAAGR